MPEKCDVVVIGGGISGLAAAKAAASEGAKTMVLEMRAGVGEQGGFGVILPPELSRRFKAAVEARPDGLWMLSPGEKVKVRKRFSIARRSDLIAVLCREAVEAGAEIWINSPVQSLIVKDGVVKGVRAEGGGWAETVSGEVVIDASGASGQWSSLFLRKILGGEWSREQLAFSSEYLLAGAEGCEPELHFSAQLAPAGKCWIFPMKKGFASAGISGIRIHPDLALDDFLGRLSSPALSRAAPMSSSRVQLSISGPLSQTVADGIIAVGASAGQLFPTAPESVFPPLICGEIAGREAVEAITSGDVTKSGLQNYQEKWRQGIGREIEACRIFSSSISIMQDEKMDELLGLLDSRLALGGALAEVFLGSNVGSSLRRLCRSPDFLEVIGDEAASKITKLLRG